MRKILYLLLLLFCSVNIFSQSMTKTYTLKGNVSDSSGESIIGANIKIQNTTTGTITDLDGNFSLLVSGKATELVVSFIGYKSQIVKLKEGQNDLRIVLKDDAQQLDEVVVVGYGTQKKSSLTSSVEVIRSEDLLNMPVINLDEALSGQAAGLQVMSTTGDPSSGKEASIRIRGINNAPLLVIDGVPRFGTNSSDSETRLSDLNPDDIESISILKDAAAAAVYGSRAANGVILVQTKRAKGDKKVQINYRGQFNLQQATQLPEFLNSYDFAKLFNRAVENSESSSSIPYTDEQLEMIRTGSNRNIYANENLVDYLNKFGYSTIHSLSVNGGNEHVKYYISAGYTNTKGLYSGIGRDRFNYSMKLDATLLKGLVLSLDMSGVRSENKNTSSFTIDAAYGFSPVQPLRFTDNSLASISGSNPLIGVEGLGGYVRDKTNLNTITANLKYDIPGVKGLSAYLKGTFDTNNAIRKTFDKPTTLYLYSKETGVITEDPLTTYPKAKISLTERDQNLTNMLLELGLNYNRTFAKVHEVSGMLIVNYQDTQNRYLSGINQDMPGIYPEVIGTAVSSKLTGDEFYTQRASLIGRFTYGYASRYFIEGNFRVDGSTKFHPDNRWGFFPSVSASWVTSNEKFFKNWEQRVLSNLKFRASIGVLGDDGSISDYDYLQKYMYVIRQGYNIGGNLKPGITMDISSFPNPDLMWGKSRDYNVATDLGFWDNRFGLTYEYYWRYRTNGITIAPAYLYPPSTGVDGNPPNMNFSELKAWGWDLTLTHKNSINKVKYDVALTLSKSQDEYTDYGDESSIAENRRRVGKSSMLWWVYEADGLFQSAEEIANHKLNQDGQGNVTLAPGDIKYKDQNGDNELSDLDRIAVKNSSNPELSMSLRLGIRYKGFFANAMFQGVNGYQQNIKELYTLENSSLQRFQNYHLTDTWTVDNPNAKYPRVKIATKNDNNRQESTFWVEDCSFIRLKSLSIGYALQPSVLKKMKISSMSISLQGSNLFTWSTLKGMDPESLRGYPIQRSYGMTLNFGL